MTDYFALLDVPRRPWLDPDSLKEKYLALSGKLHPDRAQPDASDPRGAHDRYTEINSAYHSLLGPRERLSHLLQLERGTHASELQNIPADLMNVSLEVGGLCRQIDSFLTEKNAATSPLLKVKLFERGQEFSDQVAAMQARLVAAREELVAALKEIDAQWQAGGRGGPPDRAMLLPALEELRRLFGFYDRWISQLRERFVQLAL